jgi:heptose I phosphotransferase
MIDFHRLAHHPLTRPLWATKDLAQLMYSSEIEGIDARDRIRFWAAYRGADRHTRSEKLARAIVLARARRYRRHNAKHVGQAQSQQL